MKKYKSKLIALGTILVTAATVASPILFTTACAKGSIVNDNNNNNSNDTVVDDNTNNNDNTNNSGGTDNSGDSNNSNDSTNNDASNDSNNGSSNGSGSTSGGSTSSGDSTNGSGSTSGGSTSGGSSSNGSSSSGSGSTSGGSSSNGSSSSGSGSTSGGSTDENKVFVYDKSSKSASINATSLGLSDNIFDAYKSLYLDNSKSSKSTQLSTQLVSLSNGYLKLSDSIDYSNYKLNLSSIASNDWSIELPITSTSNTLKTIYINFENNYSKLSELLDSNSITVNSGDYFPYANLSTIKSITPTNIIKILKSPITGNATGISTNFSFLCLDGSKSNTSDNVLSFDYSNSSGRSLKYLITYNGNVGVLNIKNSSTTLPKTSLITSTFGNTSKSSLSAVTSQTDNFDELKFTTVEGSTNDSLIIDYSAAEKNSNLTNLLSNYLTFENGSLDYESGFGLDIAHYLSSYFNELKTKWVSEDLLTDENISFYNSLSSNSTSGEAGNNGNSGNFGILTEPSNKDQFGIMTEPSMKDQLGIMSFSTTNAAKTSTVLTKLNGAIGFELRNPTSEAVSLNLPINNTQYVLSANSIVTVVIEFNDSIAKPSLIENTSSSNSAYLSAGLTNVKMKVSETTFSTDTLTGTISYTDKNTKTYDFGAASTNIAPESYALKTIVKGVSSGNTTLSDSAAVVNAYNTSGLATSLKNAAMDQLDESFDRSVEAVGAIQNIMLKMSDNPTIYSFLQGISTEVTNLLSLFTSDEYLPSIVGGLFSSNSISTYLASNIKNITKFLAANNTSNSSIVNTVIEVLELIVESNPTQQNFHDLLAELEKYLPLAKTYLPADAQFLLPLIETLVPYLSNDRSILDITFENLDYILDFVISSADSIFINSSVVNVLNSLKNYLQQLLIYSKYYGAANSVNKYKSVKVFSVLTNEMFSADSSKSILTLISSFLSLNPNTTSNIADILTQVQALLQNNLKFKKQIEDYSKLTFNNVGTEWYALKWEWKYTGTPTRVLIATQLGKIFDSLVYVKVGNKTSDLYTALKTNVKKEVVKNTFSYSSSNKTVTQDFTVKYSFIETVTIDTTPICVLLNNMEDTTDLGLTSGMASQINQGVNVFISRMVVGRNIPHSQGAGFNITNGRGLGWLFPTDIVIKPDVNYVTISYSANNAKVYPTVDKYTGAINFSWDVSRSVGIQASNVLTDSNSAFKSKKITQASWYGSAYGFLTQDLNNLAKIFGIQFTKVPFSKVLGGLIKFDGGFTTYTTITTNLNNPTKISNYDANIANTEYSITQLKSASDIKAFLKNIVTTYGKWTTSSATNKPELTVSLPSSFKSELAKYFNITSNFNSDAANYSYGFSGLYYQIPLDANLTTPKATYQYTFTIKFSMPTVFTSYEEQNVPQTTKLIKQLSYSFIVKA